LKTLKTSLLSKKDIFLPDSSGFMKKLEKCKPTSNTRQQEQMQQDRIINMHKNTPTQTHIRTHSRTNTHIHRRTHLRIHPHKHLHTHTHVYTQVVVK
jgi:hypothetical protein